MTMFPSLARICGVALTGIVLAACGAGVPQANHGVVWPADVGARAPRTKAEASWMARSTTGALLYISDIGGEDVDVFTYPGAKLVGTLTGFSEPNGLCADRKGDVFVTDTYHNRVVEYAHGGTAPIATLRDSGPIGCAVDSKSGDLAVTSYNAAGSGLIEIYKKARGIPTSYSGLYETYFCTYDDSGDLFVDGFGLTGRAALSELAKGAATLASLRLQPQVGWAAGLAWDGQHVAMGDSVADKFMPSQPPNVIYLLTVGQGLAQLDQTMPLGGAGDVVQFWLHGKTVIAPDARNEDVGFFRYPQGGNPTKMIGGFYEPVGAALSN
jgi:hypothetical protein